MPRLGETGLEFQENHADARGRTFSMDAYASQLAPFRILKNLTWMDAGRKAATKLIEDENERKRLRNLRKRLCVL